VSERRKDPWAQEPAAQIGARTNLIVAMQNERYRRPMSLNA